MPNQTPNPEEFRLSAEAQDLVEKTVSRWRAKLVQAAREIAIAQSADTQELSSSDIEAAAKTFHLHVESPTVATRLAARWARGTRLLILLAGALVLVALGLLAAYQGVDTADQVASIVAGFVSLVTLVIAFISWREARSTAELAEVEMERGYYDDKNRFLLMWATLENGIRDKVSTSEPTTSITPLRSILRSYARETLLDENDVQELTELLRLRNQLAHAASSVDIADVSGAMPTLQRQLDKLHRG